jgi:hypothetical protein
MASSGLLLLLSISNITVIKVKTSLAQSAKVSLPFP